MHWTQSRTALTKAALVAIAALLAALAMATVAHSGDSRGPLPAPAGLTGKNGADDAPGDNRGVDAVTGKNGADDAPGDNRGVDAVTA